MAPIVNNDKLTLLLTQYGLDRIAEAMAEPSLNLNIAKIKFGNGENNEYYTPSEAQTSLKGDLGLEFFIYKKELLEDNLTVSFYTIIPENIGGFDIREVGLYETVNGEDKLFAIGTCQPFVKPTTADNYFITIDYYIFLKAANFASVYDRITLDSEHSLVTEPDMEEMLRTFLFSSANLINQIGNNSRIIGYNRATQLYERINENKTSYSYITLYKNYASLLGMSSSDSVFSFWVFDISRRLQSQNSIVDLSPNANYLSTTVPVSSLKRIYNGFMSTFSMKNANFYLNSSIPVQLFDDTTNEDIPFVIAFALRPLTPNTDRTLIAKSNYSIKSHTFEFTETSEGRLQIKLFTDASNYLTFTSDLQAVPETAHSVVLSYDPESKEFVAFINSEKIPLEKVETGHYTRMKELPGTLYLFSCSPSYSCYSNSTSTPTTLLNEDGSPYEGEEWKIEDSLLTYNGNPATPQSTPITVGPLYAWTYDDGENPPYTVWTKVSPADSTHLSEEGAELYNSDFTLYNGEFYVNGDQIIYDGFVATYTSSLDVPETPIYEWKYIAPEASIYANKSSNPTSLYTVDTKELYTGSEWEIVDGNVYYMEQRASYKSTSLDTKYPDLTSYIVDAEGKITKQIDAEVGIISIVKDKMAEDRVRALSLLLCATMGINPYVSDN